jgi:hypothetical protein
MFADKVFEKFSGFSIAKDNLITNMMKIYFNAFSSALPEIFDHRQGDKNGRIFATWAFFEPSLKNMYIAR